MTKTTGSTSGIFSFVKGIVRPHQNAAFSTPLVARLSLAVWSRNHSISEIGGFVGNRNGKVEFGTVWFSRRGPQAPTVGLHDAPTNGKPHAHAGGLGRE